MRIDTLDRFGLNRQLLQRWLDDGLEFLLPIQAEAVNRFGLLDGKSILISGPGTSGKTFCGELAALKKCASKEKAVFLVPLKAIAEEKYDLFKKRYAPLGLRVKLATRDFTKHDSDISRGDFDLAVVIYEKFNAITSREQLAIKTASLFIMDEFQLIGDQKRGFDLELLMIKIRSGNPAAQSVILFGGGLDPKRIANWLNMPLLEENRRPVDLRIGVLHRGTFHFRGFNELVEGNENWLAKFDIEDDSPIDPQNLAAIKHLADNSEQILIFTNSRRNAVALAAYLADYLDFAPAGEALRALEELPPSVQNDSIRMCISKGVAFHHADLDSGQRKLVEESFRRGELRVLTATSTLAWGVNLPAKNVFLDAMKYVDSSNEAPTSYSGKRKMLVPISCSDFYQAAGRAGRLGSHHGFGRAVLSASTAYEEEVLWDKYVYSQNQAAHSGLSVEQLPDLILRLIGCGAAINREAILEQCRRLLAFNLIWSERLESLVEKALDQLENSRLVIFHNWGKYELSQFGHAIVSNAISIESAHQIAEVLGGGKIIHLPDIIFFVTGLNEWTEQSDSYNIYGGSFHSIIDRLAETLQNDNYDASGILGDALSALSDRNLSNRIAACMFLMEWTAGLPTMELEIKYQKGAGGLKKDSMTMAWLISAFARISRTFGGAISEALYGEIDNFSAQLRFGVSREMLPLAQALGLDREFIRRLFEFGINDQNRLYNTDQQIISTLLPQSVARRIDSWRKKFSDKISSADMPGSSATSSISENGKRIAFTGNKKGRLSEVMIAERPIFLQPKQLAFLRKLWLAYLDGDSWLHKDKLEPGLNQAKYISKLRAAIKDCGVAIEHDGQGCYRLLFE